MGRFTNLVRSITHSLSNSSSTSDSSFSAFFLSLLENLDKSDLNHNSSLQTDDVKNSFKNYDQKEIIKDQIKIDLSSLEDISDLKCNNPICDDSQAEFNRTESNHSDDKQSNDEKKEEPIFTAKRLMRYLGMAVIGTAVTEAYGSYKEESKELIKNELINEIVRKELENISETKTIERTKTSYFFGAIEYETQKEIIRSEIKKKRRLIYLIFNNISNFCICNKYKRLSWFFKVIPFSSKKKTFLAQLARAVTF